MTSIKNNKNFTIFVILLLTISKVCCLSSFYEFLQGEWQVERTTYSAKSLDAIEPLKYGRYQFFAANSTLTGYYYENITENQEELLEQIKVEFSTLTTGEFKVRDLKQHKEEIEDIPYKTLFAFDFINRTSGISISTEEWASQSNKFYQFFVTSPINFVLNVYSKSSNDLLIETITALKTGKKDLSKPWYATLFSNPLLLIGVLLITRFFTSRQAPVRANRARAAANVRSVRNKPNEQATIEELDSNPENKETAQDKQKSKEGEGEGEGEGEEEGGEEEEPTETATEKKTK